MTARELKEYYLSKAFREAYEYDGMLGVILDEKGTELKLWSPLAEWVKVHFYRTGHGDDHIKSEPMTAIGKGVWSYQTPENLSGIYYEFELLFEGETVFSADPYARACGVNGGRSMILDLKETDPEGWEKDAPPKKEAEDIIYELHVREFSHAKEGGFSEANRGKYLAFTEKETSLYGEGKIPTGLGHIKNLGATYVQLLPIFDYASVDETKPEESFNWGYDPLNYNVPEGSYSSNPYRGEVRIRECKEMIKALHESGLRVIMDVVYNHTYDMDSWFQRTVPYYFYRLDKEGNPANGSACGNDFATEMPMAGKYILESVLYWAEEYHIDGFRFDLMGLIDIELMNRIRKALDEKFGKGEKLVFGEPWRADETFPEGEAALADKNHIDSLDPNIGMFSDDIRDSIKGSVFHERAKGFVSGEFAYTKNIVAGITAYRGSGVERLKNATSRTGTTRVPKVLSPSQIINYVSCHDNQTLWDKLTKTAEGEERRRAEYRLAAAIYIACQGRCFLYSGEEFLRTKGGEHNSYRSPIEVNLLDWRLLKENEDIVRYYKGLFALRKTFSGLNDKGERAYENIRFFLKEEGLIGFTVRNEERDEKNPHRKEVVFLFNAHEEEKKVVLPEGVFQVLSDGKNSLKWKEGETERVSGSLLVPGIRAFILGRIS